MPREIDEYCMQNFRMSLVQDVESFTSAIGDPNKLFMVCDLPAPLKPNSKIDAEFADRPMRNDCHNEPNAWCC